MLYAPLPKLYIYNNSIYSNIYSVVYHKYITMKEFVRLRLSKQDKEFLQLEATKNKMSLSSYVRTRVLNNTIDKNGEL